MKKIKPAFLKSCSILGLFLVLFSCKKKDDHTIVKIESAETLSIDNSIPYQESFRPQFHFSPEKKWMNDPNGMVFYKGVYHLFYQYYPEDIVWGPMHWGHATSTDLIHWSNKKIALFPDKLGYIFLELRKFNKKASELVSDLDRWCYLLKHLHTPPRRRMKHQVI